jgi:hypothetical protein
LQSYKFFGLIIFRAKAFVRRHDHLHVNRFDHRQKLLIGNIGGFDLSIGNQTELISQNAKFPADDLFPRGKTFFADSFSLWLMNFTNRMTKFNAVRNNYAENSQLS